MHRDIVSHCIVLLRSGIIENICNKKKNIHLLNGYCANYANK